MQWYHSSALNERGFPELENVALATVNLHASDRGMPKDPQEFLRTRMPAAYVDLQSGEWLTLNRGVRSALGSIPTGEDFQYIEFSVGGYWHPLIPPSNKDELHRGYHLYVFASEEDALKVLSEEFRIDNPSSIDDVVGKVRRSLLRSD